ncbi:hypothetical protein ACWOBT_05340 [Gemella cuniculi]
MEYKKESIGGFIANGYDSELITFNPNLSCRFIISITNEGIFIKNSNELEHSSIPKEYFKFTGNILDKLTDVVRFKIIKGAYAHEYVIEDYIENEKFPDIMEYIKLFKEF